MTIVFVGPGAMGCLVAALFKETLRPGTHDVWLLDKNTERAEFINTHGVRIDDKNGARVVRVATTAETAVIGSANLLCLCVKTYDTGPAIRHSLRLVGMDTIVVSLQNGCGNVEQIAEVVENAQIVCGITAHGATKLGEGHVRHAGAGPTWLAPFLAERRELAGRVADLLTKSGMDATVVDDMQSMIWSKLIINSAINPLTAISNVWNGQLLEDPELRKTMRKAASEAAAVARAKGMALMYGDEVEEIEKVCRATSKNISSMLQDVRRGRRTEIDSITGVIVKEAHALGVEVPTNEMLLERVHAIEKEKNET